MTKDDRKSLVETAVQASSVFLVFTVVMEVFLPGFVTRIVPIWWPLSVHILLTMCLARLRRA